MASTYAAYQSLGSKERFAATEGARSEEHAPPPRYIFNTMWYIIKVPHSLEDEFTTGTETNFQAS
jgi:hypothetical protein